MSIITHAVFGSKKKKAVSFSIIVIMGFLIHMRNQRSNYENLKFSKLSIKDNDVFVNLFRKEKAMLIQYFLKESKIYLRLLFQNGIV
jgi:hypothetical protein